MEKEEWDFQRQEKLRMEDLYSIFGGIDTISLFPPHLWDAEALRPYPKIDNSDLDL